ncbi:MAG TPA: hypothetical protein P5519_07300 [Spirochaetia bacterium]|mgnify:FL=1|nr:hypothetical protein [Ruminococcus sp.]HQN63694.1 hypothetical protein [Flexilinea sp.]HRS65679.1 hypothetical protein [Spirochaetia bacterium]HRU99338.1 hypothetical protein [Ruminococcus sp.]
MTADIHQAVHKAITECLPEYPVYHINAGYDEQNLLIDGKLACIVYKFDEITPDMTMSGPSGLYRVKLQISALGKTNEVRYMDEVLIDSLNGRFTIDDVTIVLIPDMGADIEEADNLVKRITRIWKGMIEV